MKQITFLLFLFIAAASQSAVGQSQSNKMYDYFDGKDGINQFSFSKNMIDAIDLDLSEDDDRNVTGDLNKVRFMTYNPEKGKLSGTDFTKKAVSLLPGSYKQYKDSDDDFENGQIWLLGKRSKYSECHIFLDGDEPESIRFIVSFYGDFTVNDLKKLKESGKKMSNKD
ncbi:protein of unknown function [Mariniphaga anaerophila]|uniref:DUF4252 domain-containing protein n=1 Tax=Mariniphaga anaerophila TaxID=1484053 RepID=A0A1M5D0B9_9BACT|nr:DUF4252 domain-containing protein [Mariniphaga anaerophila]SHF60449.1 protein of unknown function [Mariniphaga anaerophila]